MGGRTKDRKLASSGPRGGQGAQDGGVGGESVLLYDGGCDLCTWTVSRIGRASKNPVQQLPWQGVDLAKLGVSEALAKDAVVLVRRGEPVVLFGVEAAAEWLAESKRLRWRLLGKVVGLSALSPVAEHLYRVVARNRYRIPGPWQGSRLRS